MLLGIDIGTTVLKVAIFERKSGRLRASCYHPIPTRLTSDGGREQDPHNLQSLLRNAVKRVRSSVGNGWNRVSGIGLASQGGSTLIVKSETGAPLTPLILWNDPRAFPEFEKIRNSHPPEFWRGFSLRDEPGMGLARIEWLNQQNPQLFSGWNLYIGAGEYIYHYLTRRWVQDPGHALQTGCYDATSHQLTRIPFMENGIPLSFFAPLRGEDPCYPLDEAAARHFGLEAGIPVAGPYIDQEAGYLSTLGVSEHPLQMSLGTAWVGNFTVPLTVTPVSPFQLVVPGPYRSDHLVILPLLTGNVTWDWALEKFLHQNHRTALEMQENLFKEKLLPPEGLVAIPWINRPNPYRPDTNGALLFSGISPACDSGDLLRAVALGMAYEMFRVLGDFCRKGHTDSIILTGGASKGLHFQKYLSTLFAPIPVRVAIDEDCAGTRGALFSFGTRASTVRVEVVRPLGGCLADCVTGGFHHYREVFERLYGHVSTGRSFEIRDNRDSLLNGEDCKQ